MIKLLVILALISSHLCCLSNQDKEVFYFTITDAKAVKQNSIKLKKFRHLQAMEVLENTLDDTCMIGIMRIAPGKTGRLYSTEFERDSIYYDYQPYKASKGKLVIKHSFYY